MMEKRQPHQLLAEFAVIVRLPVQWGELDAYGHVNNSMFFRYFESARMEYLERCGFLHSYERDKVGAILHSTQCRFKRALFFPDTIEVGTRVIEMQEDRFTMEYHVVSLGQDALVAEGTGVIVSFDYTGKAKAPIPPDVREAIGSLDRGRGARD